MSMLYYTVKDIAEMLGVSKNTAYKIAAMDDVPSMRIGKSIRIDKEGFDNWRKCAVKIKI